MKLEIRNSYTGKLIHEPAGFHELGAVLAEAVEVAQNGQREILQRHIRRLFLSPLEPEPVVRSRWRPFKARAQEARDQVWRQAFEDEAAAHSELVAEAYAVTKRRFINDLGIRAAIDDAVAALQKETTRL